MISAYIWQINLFWRPRRKLYLSVAKYLVNVLSTVTWKANQVTAWLVVTPEEKTAKKKKLTIDCCLLCLARYYKKEISSGKNYPVFKQRWKSVTSVNVRSFRVR